jgi:hypothetical protein
MNRENSIHLRMIFIDRVVKLSYPAKEIANTNQSDHEIFYTLSHLLLSSHRLKIRIQNIWKKF